MKHQFQTPPNCDICQVAITQDNLGYYVEDKYHCHHCYWDKIVGEEEPGLYDHKKPFLWNTEKDRKRYEMEQFSLV